MQVPTGLSKWIPIPFQLSALIGLQVWSLFSNKFGRISALYWGGFIWISACIIAMCLPALAPNTTIETLANFNNKEILKLIALIVTIILVGFGASTAYLIPWSLLPDAIDSDPEKPAGIYTAWMVLVQKIGIGLSVQILGLLLSFSGYRSLTQCTNSLDCLNQPMSAELTIRICMGLIPALFVAVGLLIMRKWPNESPNILLKSQ